MAKKEQEKKVRLDPDGNPYQSFNEMLKHITPPLLKKLRLHAGDISQAKFGDRADISARQMSAYNKRREAPKENIAWFAPGAGISSEQLWWVLGRVLVEEYGKHRFELLGQPSEVREPQTPYGETRPAEPSLAERVESILQRDLSRLDSHSMLALNHDRQLIRQLLDDSETDAERWKQRLEQAIAVHEMHYEAAVRRPPGSESS